jgi:bisphosphoglycerate-independent phosphoglycerate mutase (AlkP superfamily)
MSEFVFTPPLKLAPRATVSNGDSVIFFNYRADRARSRRGDLIVAALTQSWTEDIEKCLERPARYE